MAQSFHAQVSAWAAQSQQRLTNVFRDATQTVANEVRKPKSKGGNMPVDLGNLRRSLMASAATMPTVRTGKDQEFAENDGAISLVIAGASIGQTIYLGFQAGYARRREYGFSGADALGRHYSEAGDGFVRLTAQRWPEIVADSAWKIQRRTEARAAFTAISG